MLVFALRMASSMAGKIWSPFNSTSTLLPSMMGGPSSTPIERRNWASWISYWRVSWVSICFSLGMKFRARKPASRVTMLVIRTMVKILERI